jgi:radical SAM superfamily enzyme YgiQ (UPF0313 family)
MRTTSPRVLLIHPRFSPHSFWNYRETCAAMGVRYSAAPLGLITVAALLPRNWPVRLIDRNVEELQDRDLEGADLVMIGGMLSQQRDAKAIIARAHAHGRPVVMGGPDATSSPAVYAEAEFLVLGEAEEVMAEFVTAWRSGAARGRFEAQGFPDLGKSPLPRFDLLKLQHYLHVGVQFSRGCPYNCEFCNVIELNGRVPRHKAADQVLRELDALHALGYRGHVDFVDDNLIGNRGAARSLLTALAAWNEKRRHPFEFSSETSLNLADDEQLLQLMQRAGFFAVFIGIETPDREALRSAQKVQNVHQDMVASVLRIHRAGIFVNGGFILGLDAEGAGVGPLMDDLIEAMAVPVCMVGLLYALPGTQLAERLRAEGRLFPDADRLTAPDDADQCTSGLNFATMRPRREILGDYRTLLQRIYAPAAFFGRVRRLDRVLDLRHHRVRRPLRYVSRDLRGSAHIIWRLGMRDPATRGPFWRAIGDCLLQNPRAIRIAMSFAGLYLHVRPFSRFMDAHLAERLAGSLEPLLADAGAGVLARRVAVEG